MATSSMEFYKKGKVGKIVLDWHGHSQGGDEVFHKSYQALQQVEKVLIVAHVDHHTAATCFRIILQIFREAQRLGVETEVVLPEEEIFDAAEVTGFSTFYRVFLTEAEALNQLDITDFYPLVLVALGEENPDPLAA